MRPSKMLATVLMAGAIPMFAGSAAAAPLAQSKALSNADVSAVEQVQWRRGWRNGRWVGPAIGGFAAGVAIGSAAGAYAYDDGYYAYGAAPGYNAYGAAPGYAGPGRGWSGENYGNPDTPSPGSSSECFGMTSDAQSAYPSWACR